MSVSLDGFAAGPDPSLEDPLGRGGVETAVERAGAAAGGKDVHVSGGADVVQQCIRAGLVDVLDLHLVPIFLGAGRRVLDGLEPARLELERAVAAPRATHVRYR